MLPMLSQKLLAQWPTLPLKRPKPGQLHFLGMRTETANKYAIFLGFADQERAPCLVMKIARKPPQESGLHREWDILNHFQQPGFIWINGSIPNPVLWAEMNGANILVTTAPKAKPFEPSLNSAASHFASVTNWLEQLAQFTRTTSPPSVIHQGLTSMATQLFCLFKLSNEEMLVIENWKAACLKTFEHDRIDFFAAHCNLHYRNIWLQPEDMTIVNWEQGELTCLPLQDIFTFLTTYRFPATNRVSKETFLRAFQVTYLADNPYSDLVSKTIIHYCQSLNIPLEAVEAYFGLFLARAALQEYNQLLAATQRGYLPLLKNPDTLKQPHQQAIKEQLWINLLRLMIQERRCFKPATLPKVWGQLQPIPVQKSLSAEQPQVSS